MKCKILSNFERNLILSKLEEAGFAPSLVCRNEGLFLGEDLQPGPVVTWTYEIYGYTLITMACEKEVK